MKIWWNNMLPLTSSLTATNTTENPSVLYHPFRGNNIAFTANNTVMNAQWAAPINIDSIIITDCEALNVRAQLYNGATLLRTINFTPRSEPITVVMFDPLNVTRVVLTVTNMPADNWIIGKLYIGERFNAPLFKWGSYTGGLNIPSGNTRTFGGQVYGNKQPTYESMGGSFQKITNEDLRRIKTYATTVQKSTPHFIAPYDTDDVRPIYGVLDTIGKEKRNVIEDNGQFFWDIDLSWSEAR